MKMNAITLINAVADFVALNPSSTWQRTILRFLVFLWLSVAAIKLGEYVGLPVSVGWMFGYAWGALTVYGHMRRQCPP